jgi:membrane-associated phospholipid phosphatase
VTVARARIAGASLAAVAWVAFLLLTTTVVRHPAPFAVDASVSPALVDWAVGSTFVTGLCRGLDVAGGYLIDVMIVLVVFVLLVRAARALMGVSLIASALGGVLLSDAVKAWVDRPRPPTVGVLLTETTSSYPSGHTTSGLTVWVPLAWWHWWPCAPACAGGSLRRSWHSASSSA